MDLAIALDSRLPQPLHQQIYEELRRAILTGRLLPRQKIPSTRSLAKSLGISRTTVTQSYEQLLSEGYLQTIVGSGTYVCAQLPDDLLHSVPVDDSGLMVEKLANSYEERIRMVYVTPSHQFPTGSTLSLPRRLELLLWAQQHDALILEDDYDSEYRYGDRPIPALQGLDQSDCVIYIGTFSKVLFPSLRIGYLVVPPHLVSLFAQVKWLSDRQLPTLEQKVLAEFIADGYLESHIRKMRSLYDQRRQVLVQALNTHFGEQVTIFGENAGIHIMVKFDTHLSDETIIERAERVGVGLMSARSSYLNSWSQGEFIFGYAELDEIQIQEGISRLAQAFN
ncbi:PLP-dependent aminotransferase family protein [Anabaena sp. WFMT]|uniref:aminotransferase-like domain-containing protein n=1 Tax=Anabaena sp. WFMT TaxID=3449730 RepID=UPI003F258326